ncbi:hypothetical protein ElyMa_001782300 [Elysia marginata]|uniref:Uncharacterized protein n=1 Tax=Elysia marginata TaxID=1093978 RepID=A0AAV4EDW6_9GAST|nr:hypothetical protein ElyMa_001782300 [Elysia marginata]
MKSACILAICVLLSVTLMPAIEASYSDPSERVSRDVVGAEAANLDKRDWLDRSWGSFTSLSNSVKKGLKDADEAVTEFWNTLKGYRTLYGP